MRKVLRFIIIYLAYSRSKEELLPGVEANSKLLNLSIELDKGVKHSCEHIINECGALAIKRRFDAGRAEKPVVSLV